MIERFNQSAHPIDTPMVQSQQASGNLGCLASFSNLADVAKDAKSIQDVD